MPIIRKTGLLVVMLSMVMPVWAEEEQVPAETQPAFHREAGEVEGFSPLSVGDEAIPATLISEQLGEPRGKILILHDSAGGIASAGLVNTLRLSMPTSGWTTMTVALTYPQTPELFLAESSDAESADDEAGSEAPAESDTTAAENDTSDSESLQAEPIDNSSRISAALANLNAQQPGPVVIIAIGESVPLALSAASQQGDDKAQIWLATDMTLTELPELGPVLDITNQLAGDDNADAKRRQVFMRKANNPLYSQRSLLGAGQHFQGFERQVLTIVRAWLHKHFNNEVQS